MVRLDILVAYTDTTKMNPRQTLFAIWNRAHKQLAVAGLQDRRHNLTVKSISTEEHPDAAKSSRGSRSRGSKIRKHPIHIIRRSSAEKRCAKI